jgi:hypothetical protein
MHHSDSVLSDQFERLIDLKTAHDDLSTAAHKRHDH